MAGNKIYIQVDFQSEGATAAVNKLNEQIKNVGTTSTKATKEAATGFNAMTLSISQTTRGLDQIGQTLAGLGIARALAGMVQASDDIKKTSIAFQAMGANAYEAANAIAAIRDVAKTSPFSFDDLRDMAQRMRAFGFDLKQIPSLINTVANAAAALGRGKVAVDSITLALGQMRAKGIIQGQEAFRQLAEQSINSIKYLQGAIQKETGKAVSELDVRKMIEKQMIGSEKGVQVILDGMVKDFGAAGERMAKELPTAQFEKMADDVKKVGAAIADDFAPSLIKAIGGLRELTAWFGRLPPFIQDVTVAIGLLVVALTVLGGAAKLGLLSWIPAAIGLAGNLATAFGTLRLALQVLFTDFSVAALTSRLALISTMTPAVVNLAVAVGAVGAAFLGWKAGEWMREKIEPNSWLGRLLNRDVEAKAKAFGKEARADMEATARKYQQWMTEQKLPEAANMSIIPFNKQTDVELQDSLRKMRMLLDAEAIANKARAAKLIQASTELAKHQEQIADQILARARARMHGAIFGINDKYANDLKELAGNAKQLAKVFEAMADDLELAKQKIAEDNIRLLAEKEKERLDGQKAISDYFAEYARGYTETLKRHLAYVEESDKIERETLTSRLEFEQTALAADRDQKLAEADVVHRQTLDQELTYQQTVFEIKRDYAERIRDVERQLADQKYEEELALVEALHDVKLMSDMDYLIRSAALWAANEEKKKQITVRADVGISKDRLEAAKATNDAIINEQKQIYDKLKSSLDRVFDALLNKSTSVWEAIANGLKTAIIGAIKEIVTSRAAAALMQLFGYGTVDFGGGPRGLGGQQPTFGGGVTGAVGTGGFLARIFGARGGTGGTVAAPAAVSTYGGYTGGYSPANAAAGAPVAMPGFGAMSLKAGLLSSAAFLGGGMAAINGIQRGGKVGLGQTIGGGAAAGIGAAHMAAAMGLTTAGGTLGLSALGGGLLGAGVGLAGYGLYRGGKAGIGLTAAGGALTGAVLGTAFFPGIGTLLGAGIGAAVGGIAGLFRSLVKTADSKLQSKIKSVYGIDVQDKGVRATMLEIAKQKYGGNLDLAIRSSEIQNLVQLYALTTAQNPVGMPQKMYGATFAQSGAGLQLQPVYSNGQLVANPYMSSSNYGAGGIYLQLNPQQANDLFEGRVVSVISNNPDSVGQAAATASRSGRSRDAQRSALLEPLTVIR